MSMKRHRTWLTGVVPKPALEADVRAIALKAALGAAIGSIYRKQPLQWLRPRGLTSRFGMISAPARNPLWERVSAGQPRALRHCRGLAKKLVDKGSGRLYIHQDIVCPFA